jgi:hypothetical protein
MKLCISQKTCNIGSPINEKHYEILRLLQYEALDKDWHQVVYYAWEKSILFEGVDDFNQHLLFLETNGLIDIDTANGQYYIKPAGQKLYRQRHASVQKDIPLDYKSEEYS